MFFRIFIEQSVHFAVWCNAMLDNETRPCKSSWKKSRKTFCMARRHCRGTRIIYKCHTIIDVTKQLTRNSSVDEKRCLLIHNNALRTIRHRGEGRKTAKISENRKESNTEGPTSASK